MARVAFQKPAKQANAGSAGVRGGRVQKQRKKHKVVLETAGNKDEDKLRVVLSFHSDPPPGYTFIPAGNTQLTAAMKGFAKRGGLQVMAVSATPHAQRHELSREVHRIGYHFPTEVVSQVCSQYGIRLDSSGRIIGEKDAEQLFMKISQKGEVVLNENIRDQVTINTEAKEIIRDLFPKIPDNDLFQIIKTAFQLGDNKVGTAEEIPLVRRAQLSVVAHIRHSYTNYDKLLRQVPYNEARHMVEKTTLMKLVEWRGDENDLDENSRKAVDDAVREVVVLSDEESDSELEEGQVLENQDVKVEPVRRPTRPTVHTEHMPLSPAELSSGEDAPQGYRFVPRVAKRNPYDRPEADPLAEQQSRYAVWDQVRHEYQSRAPVQEPTRVITRFPLDNATVARPVPVNREVVYDNPSAVRYVLEEPQPARIIRQPSPPTLFRGADGRLYERLAPRHEEARRIYTPPSGTRLITTHHARRSVSPRAQPPTYHRRTPSLNDNGTIVQSIERSDVAYNSLGIRQTTFGTHHIPAQQSEKRIPEPSRHLIDLTDKAEQADQRMRTSPSPPPSPYLRRTNNGNRDVDMTDENVPLRHRQLIDLSHQLPIPVSGTSRTDLAQHHISRPYDQYMSSSRAPVQQEYSHPGRDYQEGQYYPREPARLPERRVVYEPIEDSQLAVRSVRYAGEPVPAFHGALSKEQYFVHDDYPEQRQPPPMQASYLGARQPVYRSAVPMDDVRPTVDSRYQPTYRTTYVQN